MQIKPFLYSTAILIFSTLLISSCLPKVDDPIILENDSYFTYSIDNGTEVKYENKKKGSEYIEEAHIVNSGQAGTTLLQFQLLGKVDYNAPYAQAIMSISSIFNRPLLGRYTASDSLSTVLMPQLSVSQFQSFNVIKNQYIVFPLISLNTDFIQIDNFGLNKGDIVSGSYHFGNCRKNLFMSNSDTLPHTIAGKFKLRIK